MTGTTTTNRKLSRSNFFRSLDTVRSTDHSRTARLDLWGVVSLTAVLGMFARLIQILIMN